MSIPSGRPLTVWMVNYNSVGFLTACLSGLSSPRIRRIVILDNASSSADRYALDSLASGDCRVSVIWSDHNLGFGAGHRAIAEFTAADRRPGDQIWILNPDTVVTSAAVERLSDVLGNDEADIVSPILLTGDPANPVTWFAGGDIDIRQGRVTHRNAGKDPKSNPGVGLIDSPFISGAATMMSRAAWDRLDGFRADLFLYWEDVDLSLRAQQLGLRMAVVSDAVIWHSEGGSTSSGSGVSPTAYYYSARNRILVASAFGNAVGLVLGRGFPFFLRLAATALLKGRRQRVAKLAAVMRGTLDGIRGRTGPKA